MINSTNRGGVISVAEPGSALICDCLRGFGGSCSRTALSCYIAALLSWNGILLGSGEGFECPNIILLTFEGRHWPSYGITNRPNRQSKNAKNRNEHRASCKIEHLCRSNHSD